MDILYSPSGMQDVLSAVSGSPEAISGAPIVLSSFRVNKEHAGNIYLETKNTFLEFYTDESKEIKRSACSRSLSCDSVLRRRCDSRATTAGQSSSSSNSGSDRLDSPSVPSNLPSDSEAASPTEKEKWSDLSEVKEVHEAPVFQALASHECHQYNGTEASLWSSEAAMEMEYPESSMRCAPKNWMPEVRMPMVVMPMIPMMAPIPAPDAFSPKNPTQQPPTSPKKANICPKSNKKKSDLTKLNPPPSDYAGITTLMIRGIPCSFVQEDLLNLVESAGLGDKYDFFYMPRAGCTSSNLGYAFINFIETIDAWTCAFTFNDIRLDPSRSAKTCTVSPADIQGIPNLRKHFRRAVVSRGPNGPIFLGDAAKKGYRNMDKTKKVKNLREM